MTALKASHPLRVFVVEDHPDTLVALCLYLKVVGHNVRSARTKEEALRKIPEANCDVLISDIGLPDGSGWGLIREIGDCRQRLWHGGRSREEREGRLSPSLDKASLLGQIGCRARR